MHILPQLRKLERKYARELVVVGVHTAKFPSERETHNLLKAILRYEIEHPVVNDGDFQIWNQYAVRAWPTLIFVDPLGRIIGKHEGEFSTEVFDPIVEAIIGEFDQQNAIDRSPLRFKLEQEKEWERPLSFPGKVLADPNSSRLFIADSNHNRVVATSLDGQVQQVIGSGEAGLKDGDFGSALFNHPQGMTLEDEILYVADTENHSLRKVDLSQKKVETIAGTGQQATTFHTGSETKSTTLNSPWDLAIHDGILYIAMAGFHQLWAMDLNEGLVYPYAGSGREFISDGSLLSATLAQPSGIATDGMGKKLYFVDSETSSIRTANINPSGVVSTIVGLGLFDFGDIDGTGDEVRLQHPLGLTIHDGVLYVADTYNNKIKRVYPDTRGVAAFLGSGEPGHLDGQGNQAVFHEPGGLSAAHGKLYIADTNNHAIRVADLETGEVHTLEIRGL